MNVGCGAACIHKEIAKRILCVRFIAGKRKARVYSNERIG